MSVVNCLLCVAVLMPLLVHQCKTLCVSMVILGVACVTILEKLVDRTVKYPIDVCDYEDRDNNNNTQDDMAQPMQEGITIK